MGSASILVTFIDAEPKNNPLNPFSGIYSHSIVAGGFEEMS